MTHVKEGGVRIGEDPISGFPEVQPGVTAILVQDGRIGLYTLHKGLTRGFHRPVRIEPINGDFEARSEELLEGRERRWLVARDDWLRKGCWEGK